ncbi:uncharacterized protein F4822DRAFT_26526 [Hypoxylon trugodes]|uniref:uncharacterized protein n=1 Tax=Hypoxylon trugodes TaxID=326681 RepID=UPI002191987B|nr:uncharacterized protein F4822DRAFT_26526 [Hypoxylon trugodes]KAI1393812.1 hypothetical protein F4822DRAFT_26526 [Hypoxylon trugodes]
MSTTRADLGLSCPAKGKFYVCDSAKIRFIGCCTIDPCADGSGNCPSANLASASFSSDHYDSIPAQNCAPPRNVTRWFTCKSSQPFLGCCGDDPCANSGCPAGQLLPATLSDDPTNAQVFLTTTSSSPSPSSTPSGSSGYSLPLGAILGIALGGAALVAIILAIVAYRCGWLARRKRHEKAAEGTPSHYSGAGPYSPGASPWHEGSQSGGHSPRFPSPGIAPYSPSQHHYHPTSQSPPPSDSWHGDSRHVSQMSELGGGWNPASGDRKQAHYAPLLSPPAMELEGRDTERRIVAELPAGAESNHR